MTLSKALYTLLKLRKRVKIRNRYNQAPHLTQDTNGKVKTSQLDITNESQEVSLLPIQSRNTGNCSDMTKIADWDIKQQHKLTKIYEQ